MRSVEIRQYVHSGGTKDYILVILKDESDSDGEYEWRMMRRNGSANAVGQMQRATVGPPGVVNAALDKEDDKRRKRDYRLHSKLIHKNANEFETAWRGTAAKWAQPGAKIYGEIIEFLSDHTASRSEPEPLAEIDRGDDWGSW